MRMNEAYLQSLPEGRNEYGMDLIQDERVLFTAELSVFGDEKDRVLGTMGAKFTLTNKRIIADNGVGIWTVDMEEITGFHKVQQGRIFKSVFFSVDIDEWMEYDDGKGRLKGFHFYFNKKDTAALEELIHNLFL